MMIAVGLDHTSADIPSRCAAPAMAISSRGAEVPYWCSRRASSSTKAMRVVSAVVANCSRSMASPALMRRRAP